LFLFSFLENSTSFNKTLLNISLFVDFSNFPQKLAILNKKNFGQKIVDLAHSEGYDVAKTSLCPIFKYLGSN
jgi:hypothetical protein